MGNSGIILEHLWVIWAQTKDADIFICYFPFSCELMSASEGIEWHAEIADRLYYKQPCWAHGVLRGCVWLPTVIDASLVPSHLYIEASLVLEPLVQWVSLDTVSEVLFATSLKSIRNQTKTPDFSQLLEKPNSFVGMRKRLKSSRLPVDSLVVCE